MPKQIEIEIVQRLVPAMFGLYQLYIVMTTHTVPDSTIVMTTHSLQIIGNGIECSHITITTTNKQANL